MSHLTTIKQETNGKIDDSHFGEVGHLQLFNELKLQYDIYKDGFKKIF